MSLFEKFLSALKGDLTAMQRRTFTEDLIAEKDLLSSVRRHFETKDHNVLVFMGPRVEALQQVKPEIEKHIPKQGIPWIYIAERQCFCLKVNNIDAFISKLPLAGLSPVQHNLVIISSKDKGSTLDWIDFPAQSEVGKNGQQPYNIARYVFHKPAMLSCELPP